MLQNLRVLLTKGFPSRHRGNTTYNILIAYKVGPSNCLDGGSLFAGQAGPLYGMKGPLNHLHNPGAYLMT